MNMLNSTFRTMIFAHTFDRAINTFEIGGAWRRQTVENELVIAHLFTGNV